MVEFVLEFWGLYWLENCSYDQTALKGFKIKAENGKEIIKDKKSRIPGKDWKGKEGKSQEIEIRCENKQMNQELSGGNERRERKLLFLIHDGIWNR